MQVEDLIHTDGLASDDRLTFRFGLHAGDLFDSATGDREDNDEGHLALGACDLQVKAPFLMAQDLDIAAFQTAPAHRAVVEAGPVADELDDAHRGAHITPHETC